MALITPPAKMPIRRISWTLKQPHQVNRSGWTGRRQVMTTPGPGWWACSAEFIPIIGEANAKKWRSFFNRLLGQTNTFPAHATETNQHGGANPTVGATAATGATTMTLSVTIPLVAGDFMTVALSDGTYQMVMLTAPVSGTTATFLPPLRASASPGNPMETVTPWCQVALTSDAVEFSVDAGQIYGFAFDAEEAF